MSSCIDEYNFQRKLESIWSSFLKESNDDKSSFSITNEDLIKSLFNEHIIDSGISEYLGDNYENGFLIIKFPDRNFGAGIRVFPFMKSQNPYHEIREEYEKSINFSSLIYEKDLHVKSTFAFYVNENDDENFIKLNDFDIIHIKEKNIFDNLDSIKRELGMWMDSIKNKKKYKGNFAELINDNLSTIEKNVDKIEESLKSNELYKHAIEFFKMHNLNSYKYKFIFFIKMALSVNSIAIFKTTPLHLAGYDSPLSIIWQVKVNDGSNISKDLNKLFSFANSMMGIVERLFINKVLIDLKAQQLKTAIISILVDSYAHNISAHSLAALKWWIELRHKMLDKRFSITIEPNKSEKFPKLSSPKFKSITFQKTLDTTKKYYEALGLTDSSYDAGFYSLYDFLQFADAETTNKLFSFTKQVKLLKENDKDSISFTPRFPIPIDYALFPFFRFLRDKGAFWSGVTRDVANGGETKTWYKILWEDFANNPLYLGTIAKSEGITKININLAVKSKAGFIHGRFVTIDMSAIDYEEALMSNSNLELDKKERNIWLKIKHKDEPHCTSQECICDEGKHDIEHEECFYSKEATDDKKYVEADEYSKYAFIRLGKCFAHFRDLLDKEEFNVFLPGGVVGEHALFTIFENTIRNIKHYKEDLNKTSEDGKSDSQIKKDGIDFWISIEKKDLDLKKEDKTEGQSGDKKDEKKEASQLFKVSVWFGHETELGDKKTLENGEITYDEVLIKKVTDCTFQSILDDNGAPRMGGNSQDKACAAMLFNNDFKSVERKTNEKENKYYPWVTFSTAFTEKPFNDYFLDDRTKPPYITLKDKKSKDEYTEEYLSNIKKDGVIKNLGLLKKHFYLWQGADYLEVIDKKQLEGENISRFKFAVVNIVDTQKKNDILLQLRTDGVIRILIDTLIENKDENKGIKKQIEDKVFTDFEKNKNNPEYIKRFVSVEKETNRKVLEFLYQKWLRKWISKNNYTFIIGEKWAALNFQDSEKIIYQYTKDDRKKLPNLNSLDDNIHQHLRLSHGDIDSEEKCNIRSHGNFWGKFFNHIIKKQPNTLGKEYPENKSQLLFELFEILATQVIIYDNRLWGRFQKLPENKRNMFAKNLNLQVLQEKLEKGNFVSELNEKINKINLPIVLIMHLSFIESLHYTEESISEFIKTNLKEYIKKDDTSDNFLFVITTGRGRDAWRTSLEKDVNANSYILQKTIFKPVESLLTAVESGISYNDDFDVKYNLIKVIFGS